MNDKTGGPAFPKASLDPWGKTFDKELGMTLRDYFAAKAMQTLMASHGRVFGTNAADPTNENSKVSAVAYAVADAMLAERAK